MSALNSESLIDIELRVQSALDDLRPFLERDGGDITLVEIGHDLTVWVELHGACSTCSMSAMTMKAGLEEAIRTAVPGIKGVRAVNPVI
jgi:Fe-S cluster biogenesis protein NfuA